MGRFLSTHRYTSSIRDVCLHGYDGALPAPPHCLHVWPAGLFKRPFKPPSLPHSLPIGHPKAHVPALPHCLQEDRYGVGEERQQHQAPHDDCAVLVAAVGLHNRGNRGVEVSGAKHPPRPNWPFVDMGV